MKKNIEIKSLILGTFLGALIVLAAAAATTSTGLVALEYKIVEGDVFNENLEKSVNGAISQGWEFVSASHLSEHHAFAVLRRQKK